METKDEIMRASILKRDTDRGWAWVVLFAAFMNILLVSGFSFIAGMFQSLFLEEFDEGVGTTSWVTSLCSSLLQLAGPFSGLVANGFSCRVSVMIGGVLLTVGLGMSSIATNMYLLLFTFGIISGLGLGLIYSPSVVIVSFYFHHKRTLVTGIALSASGVGIIVFPILCQYTLEMTGGWRPTLVIMSAIMLHSCLFGALMFPIHESRECCCSYSKRYMNSWKKYGSSLEHFDIFKNPIFIIICIELFLSNCGTGILLIHFPSFMESRGTSVHNIPYALASNGISLMIARILVGALAGGDGVDILGVYIGLRFIATFIVGLAPLYASGFSTYLLIMVLAGTYLGSSYSLITPLTLKYVTVEKLPIAFGTQMIFAGAGFLVAPPIAGWVTDETHSYDYVFYIAGTTVVLSACALMMIPIIHSKTTKFVAYQPARTTEYDVDVAAA